MPRFAPKQRYITSSREINIEDFHKYSEDFVTRPPYQRKNVWSRKKQQALLDSLFRRYYIPRIVIREVRLSDDEVAQEVIDGQQRITTVQEFYADELPLPKSLSDIRDDLPGRRYSDLASDVRRFVDRLSYSADIVQQIDDPYNPEHQHIATEIFWRLQQGESLNYMEVAHARLSSTARNFVVKYADDQTFDYDAYAPVEANPSKHPFFSIIKRRNNRMQHMALLTRLLMLEEKGGSADIKQSDVRAFIDQYQEEDGVGSLAFEKTEVAQQTLQNLNTFYDAFEDDPLRAEGDAIPILKVEYFIVSLYLLLRHLREHYVFGEVEKTLFQDFAYEFHDRWRSGEEDDTSIQVFQNKRQQSASEIRVRHRIMRQLFFEYAQVRGHQMRSKDTRRQFNEAERIRIYRRDDGLCQECLAEGKPENEALVPWSEFEADHVIPHAKGGQTILSNGQVLCAYHNRQKGAGLPDVSEPSTPTPDRVREHHPPSYTSSEAEGRRWLTPVGTRGNLSPLEVVEQTVGEGRFGFSKDAIRQMRLRPGDRVVFYASQQGTVAEAQVACSPYYTEAPGEVLGISNAENFPYIVNLDGVNLFDVPLEITEEVRQQLDAFTDKDASDQWGWFVVTARKLTPSDFSMLTR